MQKRLFQWNVLRIRCFFNHWIRDQFFRILDLGSKILIYKSLVTIFGIKIAKFSVNWLNLVVPFQNWKHFKIVKLMATKKVGQKNSPHPPTLFCSCWIRDPRKSYIDPDTGLLQNNFEKLQLIETRKFQNRLFLFSITLRTLIMKIRIHEIRIDADPGEPINADMDPEKPNKCGPGSRRAE